MTVEGIRALRQALLDNAAGHPLAQVHRNNLFTMLDEYEHLLLETNERRMRPKVEVPIVRTTRMASTPAPDNIDTQTT